MAALEAPLTAVVSSRMVSCCRETGTASVPVLILALAPRPTLTGDVDRTGRDGDLRVDTFDPNALSSGEP